MPHLTEEQRQELAELIELRLTRAARDLERLERGSRPVELDGSIGRVTRMDALQNQHLAKAMYGRAADQLPALQAAQASLQAGTYGVCRSCGEPIDYERLLVMPETMTCMQCSR